MAEWVMANEEGEIAKKQTQSRALQTSSFPNRVWERAELIRQAFLDDRMRDGKMGDGK